MADLKLSSRQRRRLRDLDSAVERMVRSDARFFERFPHRQYRLRRASAEEVEQAEIMLNGFAGNLPGRRPFCAVKNVAPGKRIRLFVDGPDDADVDIDEAEAMLVYEMFSSDDGTRAVEAELRGGR